MDVMEFTDEYELNGDDIIDVLCIYQIQISLKQR